MDTETLEPDIETPQAHTEPSNRSHKNHNNNFQSVMSHTKLADELLHQHLPDNIKKLVDFSTLEMCKETYVDEHLKLLQVDVLYKAKIGGEDGYIYMLTEHMSTVDKLMPFRILKYMLRIMDNHISNSKDKTLPLVYPIVLYNGECIYNGPTDIFELFGKHDELAKSIFLKPFHLINLNAIQDEKLLESLLAGTMSYAMKHIRDIVGCSDVLIERFQILEQDEDNRRILTYILSYIIYQSKDAEQRADFVKLLQQKLSPQLGEQMKTLADGFRE
jgi:predicted transposase/invertase (TIGR01784 family)